MMQGRTGTANRVASRAWGRLPVLLALVVLALVAMPATGQAKKKLSKEFFGISQGGGIDYRDYQEMHKIKVRTMRLGLNWALTEKQPGQFQWPDGRVTSLAENGIRPAFSVYGAPRWATGSGYQGVPPLKGEARKAWKSFLKAAVKHYGPKGSFWRKNKEVPKKAVKSWQIWNEPNLPKYFAEPGVVPIRQVRHAPKQYAKLVKSSGKAIHKADKHATVVLAGLSGNPKTKKMQPDKFLKKFLKLHKIKKYYDAAALHPYSKSMKKFKKLLGKVRKVMNKKGAKKKGLWLTEVGWGSGPRDHRLNMGRKGQAKMLKKSFKTVLKKRKKWKIEKVFWFDWRDHPVVGRPACTFCPFSGLENFDRSHKPAFKQFKKFARKQGKKVGGGHHRRHHRGGRHHHR